MPLTEDEFYKREIDDRKEHLMNSFEGWTIEDHLQAMIVPVEAYNLTFKNWTPPAIEHDLEERIGQHGDALRLIHGLDTDTISQGIKTAYEKLSTEERQEINKEIQDIHNWDPLHYFRNYDEIEPDLDDR